MNCNITVAAQMNVFTLLLRFASAIEQGHTALTFYIRHVGGDGVLNALYVS